MAQRRLNQKIRKSIVNKAVEHSLVKLKSKHEKLLSEWCEKVRIHALNGKESEYMKTIGQINELAKKLPSDISAGMNFPVRGSFQIVVDGYVVYHEFDEGVKKLTQYRIYLEDKQLCKEHVKIRKLTDDIESKREEVRVTLTGLLSQFTTVNKLVEEYPELKKFVPESEVKATGTGLAIRREDLANMLG